VIDEHANHFLDMRKQATFIGRRHRRLQGSNVFDPAAGRVQ
jgi:hypothetical protein